MLHDTCKYSFRSTCKGQQGLVLKDIIVTKCRHKGFTIYITNSALVTLSTLQKVFYLNIESHKHGLDIFGYSERLFCLTL